VGEIQDLTFNKKYTASGSYLTRQESCSSGLGGKQKVAITGDLSSNRDNLRNLS
jgi:hypothetical protein